MLNIFVDAGSKNNGTPQQDAECCFVVCDNPEHPLIARSHLGSYTNNEAEFLAVEKAFDYIKERGLTQPIIVWSDSRLVVNILNHSWNAEEPRIVVLANRLFAKAPANVEVLWIPREQNKAGHILEFGVINAQKENL